MKWEWVITVKRQLNWKAFAGMLTSLALIAALVVLVLIPRLDSGDLHFTDLVFPLLSLALLLFMAIRSALAFLGLRQPLGPPAPLQNLYGPQGADTPLGGFGESRYDRETPDKPAAEEEHPDDALYQLELMRQDGAISDEEYEFSRKKILKQQHHQ